MTDASRDASPRDASLRDASPRGETASPEAPTPSPPRRINWIENDGLLRDEGVLFGLSGLSEAHLERKLDTIRHYFAAQLAVHAEAQARLVREEERLAERRADVDAEIAEQEALAETPDVPPVDGAGDAGRHMLARYLLGGAAAAGICVFNFYLVREQLAPHFEEPLYVALGVFLAGLFTVFNPASVFYTSDASQQAHATAAERWKVLLVELAMPVAAAAFVVVWRVPVLGVAQSTGLLLYLTFLFLFGGKLLLSVIPHVAVLLRLMRRQWVVRWRRWQHRRALRRLRRETVPALEAEADALVKRRNALEPPARVEAQRDTTVQLFLSEYDLARQALTERRLAPEEAAEILHTNDHASSPTAL